MRTIITLVIVVAGIGTGMNTLAGVLSGSDYCDAVAQAKAEVHTCSSN